MSASPIDKPISDFIKSNGVLTLGTADIKGSLPWVCTLYYGLDDELNLYVVTDPGSIHGKILKDNPNVAFNIFDSHTKITELKLGVQGRGRITKVTNPAELIKGIGYWHKANPGIESKITFNDLKKVKDTKLFKITPTYLKFFNKDLYGKTEYGVWERN